MPRGGYDSTGANGTKTQTKSSDAIFSSRLTTATTKLNARFNYRRQGDWTTKGSSAIPHADWPAFRNMVGLHAVQSSEANRSRKTLELAMRTIESCRAGCLTQEDNRRLEAYLAYLDSLKEGSGCKALEWEGSKAQQRLQEGHLLRSNWRPQWRKPTAFDEELSSILAGLFRST